MTKPSATTGRSATAGPSATTAQDRRPAFPWPWLLPNVALLAATAAWGIAVYPRLPARIPQHMGPSGVDAYTDKSVGAAFLPVFVQAGTVLLLAAVAFAVLRVRPESECGPAEGGRARSLTNRPATRAGALRVAKATLFLALCEGAALAAACTVMWRTGSPDAAVPGWVGWSVSVPALFGVLPLLVVAFLDRRSAGSRTDRRTASSR